MKKKLLKRLRYTEGQRDCAQGLSAKQSSKAYLLGYCEQYAKEQAGDALSHHQQPIF